MKRQIHKNFKHLLTGLAFGSLTVACITMPCVATESALPSAANILQIAIDTSSIDTFLHIDEASTCEPLVLVTNGYCSEDVELQYRAMAFHVEKELPQSCEKQVVVELRRALLEKDAALVELAVPGEGVEIILFLQPEKGQWQLVKEFLMEW